jgi:hypothetical protein
MKKPAWEKCQFYSSGRCPQYLTIDKAYLIPQLLDPSDLKAATEICEECATYHDEKRKSQRIARPFKVVVSNKIPRKNIEGTVVDLSMNGVLIKLDNWINFNKDEFVNLQLYSNDMFTNQAKSKVVNLSGRIKRVAKDKQELAIMFMKSASVKKCANI